MTSIAVVRLSAMGDLVHCLGAVSALHRVRPELRITVVTQHTFAPLLAGVAGVEQVLEFRRDGGLGALAALRRELRRRRFTHAIDLQGNWKSALVTRLAGARENWGAHAAARQEPMSTLLLRRTLPTPSRHPAVVAWTLLRRLAPELPFEAPRLEPTAAEVERERAALRAAGVDPTRPFRVFVVTDPRDARAMRPQVIAREAQRGAWTEPAIALLGPAEVDVAAPAGLPALRHAAGEVRRLLGLGGAVRAAGGRVIGPDQGATHVLAATGAACEVWFGAQDPSETAPVAAAVRRHPRPPPCAPCRRSRCTHAAGPVCMDFDAEQGPPVPASRWIGARLRPAEGPGDGAGAR